MPSRVQHRYVVIGAGAIGGCVGGVLARADVPVVLVARGRNAEVLAAEGLTLHTPDGTFRVPVVVASPEQVQLTETDVLISRPRHNNWIRRYANGSTVQWPRRTVSSPLRGSVCRC